MKKCLPWVPVYKYVVPNWQCFGGGIWGIWHWKYICHWGQTLVFQKSTSFPTSSLGLVLMNQDTSSQLLLHAYLPPCMPACLLVRFFTMMVMSSIILWKAETQISCILLCFLGHTLFFCCHETKSMTKET